MDYSFNVAKKVIDRIVTVNDLELKTSMQFMFENFKCLGFTLVPLIIIFIYKGLSLSFPQCFIGNIISFVLLTYQILP